MTCTPCKNAGVLGWWGPEHKGTHCRHCHRSWTSKAEAHCTRCHSHFSSASAADKHWTKNGHVTPENVQSLARRDDGTWTTPMDAELVARLRPA